MFDKDDLYYIADGLHLNLISKEEQLVNQEDKLIWLKQELNEFYAGELCKNDIKECEELIKALQNSIKEIKFIINKIDKSKIRKDKI